MIERLHGVAFFCEDIRQEVGERVTLVGLLPDNLMVPHIPGILPKLGIYARIHIPADWHPSGIKLFMSAPGMDRTLIGDTPEEVMRETIALTKAQNGLNGGVILTAMASPFNIAEAGRIVLECECGTETITLGSLNVQKDENPAGA